MKLDVMKRLPWPQYKDVVAFEEMRNLKRMPWSPEKATTMPDVNIMLDSRNTSIIPFSFSNLGYNQDSNSTNMILMNLKTKKHFGT